MGWGLILALIISILIAAVMFHMLRKVVPILLHGMLGLVVFWLLTYFNVLPVPIDWVTFLIAAFGGVLGIAIVIIFAAIGIPL